jgi:head-tail adaptor
MTRPQLTRQLVLESPVRVPDGSGGYVTTWTPLGMIWAEVRAGAARESAGAGTAMARVNYTVILRAGRVGASSRPTPDQRFREGSRLFTILAVAERDPDGRYLVCQTVEEIAA